MSSDSSYEDFKVHQPTFSSQPDVRTIEGVLFDALVKAGAVSQDNADDPVKVRVLPQSCCAVSLKSTEGEPCSCCPDRRRCSRSRQCRLNENNHTNPWS